MSSSYTYSKPTFTITDHSYDPFHLQPLETAAANGEDDDNDPDEDADRYTKLQDLVRRLHFNAKHRRSW